ncbi:hypothetical protein [Ornithinibacillus xuwenensis]|uniref:DUF4328 domain-containing protein n=1 Tax=Ornithinibacillus xuwenensis TaxID=3144668 RepID=A0ABU9XFB6_9BACI
MTLTNKALGKVLKAFLLVAVVLSGLLLITTTFYVYAYDVFLEMMAFDQALTVLYQIVWFISLILYFIWIFQVHADIQKITPYYDIKPGGALLRIFIPFYNLYGLWNIYSTMGNYFICYSKLEKLGKQLLRLIPVYYFLYFGSGILQRLLTKGYIVNDTVIFIYYILDFAFMISIFLMTKNILNAFKVMEDDPETYIIKEESPSAWVNE